MATLTVIRHAQASLFAADYDQLSDRGRAQARALGRRLHEEARPVDRVVTGPARRHRDTAALALPDSRPTVVAGFDEHDAFALLRGIAPHVVDDPELGPLLRDAGAHPDDPAARSAAWQTLFEAAMARWLEGEFDALVPDVEPWPVFRDRVRHALDELTRAAPRHTVLFTSVGPTAVILQAVFDCAPIVAFSTAWRQANASITRLLFSPRRRAGMLSLDRFNDAEHLRADGLVTHR